MTSLLTGGIMIFGNLPILVAIIDILDLKLNENIFLNKKKKFSHFENFYAESVYFAERSVKYQYCNIFQTKRVKALQFGMVIVLDHTN